MRVLNLSAIVSSRIWYVFFSRDSVFYIVDMVVATYSLSPFGKRSGVVS